MLAPGQRSGGSTLLRDPMTALGAAVVALPLLAGTTALWSAGSSSVPAPAPVSWALCPLILVCAALCLVQPVRKLFKVARGAQRRARLLRDLPGPSFGLLGFLPILQRRHDIHRLVTEWAEQYGPIFRYVHAELWVGCSTPVADWVSLRRVRLIFFQVRCSLQRQGRLAAC